MKLKDLKFTPGPWRVQTKEEFHLTEDNYHSIVAGDGFFDHEDHNRGFNLTSYITNDNAILVSRAPEMLEKLKSILSDLDSLHDISNDGRQRESIDKMMEEITDILNS